MEISVGFHPQKMQSIRMGEKLTKWASFIGGVLLLVPENGIAQSNTPKTETMDIQTDLPPPASAEEVVPKHPFFSEPTTGNEVFEEVEALREEVNELKKRVQKLEAKASN